MTVRRRRIFWKTPVCKGRRRTREKVVVLLELTCPEKETNALVAIHAIVDEKRRDGDGLPS